MAFILLIKRGVNNKNKAFAVKYTVSIRMLRKAVKQTPTAFFLTAWYQC